MLDVNPETAAQLAAIDERETELKRQMAEEKEQARQQVLAQAGALQGVPASTVADGDAELEEELFGEVPSSVRTEKTAEAPMNGVIEDDRADAESAPKRGRSAE